MDRTHCVICDNNTFTPVADLYNTINIVSATALDENEVKQLHFVGCVNCGCVQLKNLFLQSEIYSQPLQVFDGPAIRKHHDLFCDFIVNNINYDEELFEIGGAYGDLAKRIIKNYSGRNLNVKYKILEYSAEHYPAIDNVEYITGDCEMYNYNGASTVIMSHVFEHLYRPRNFLKKISNTDIQNIFISIPDMDNLMMNGDLNNLNILHTFYINTQYIVYLFNQNGFTLKKIGNYNSNSNFYYFKKEAVIKTVSYKNLELPTQQRIFYEKSIETIKNININKPFYICPSGFYGQFIYFHLNNETKQHLLGFLDGDNFKINKRLSGTDLNIFEKGVIAAKNEVIVLISSSKHTTEIRDELLSYNKNSTIVTLDGHTLKI
jgi:hypothetical protein